ncbi:hydrogenase formation protein HypD [Streptomyces sp. LP05-1]|uniref:Hydrogenase formation protein HypD n=1 Tax=Streptomyces pyxinae TaxID=2970734 RepID=A0ABT2CQH7_9ACTN|nr:hydrogenase formation protein HypD [Streptomyces sp. LP05-1]MCS0639516.1 hydrogenase formation protein HypD [Streptomyces sp. LP05-1]
MKYLDEFSDPVLAERLFDDIRAHTTRSWAMMEVCGGQTHSIIRHGIDQLLPEGVEMIHGPGCPVCVTPLEIIDKALEIAARPDVIFCSFGDMLRVPGSGRDLFQVKSDGGDIRVVYSPLDALRIARENPGREVVFFGIGFETTAPPNAMTVYQARKLGIENFSLLVSHVRVPPAIDAIMNSPDCRVQAFLAAGHVCTVMGTAEYPELAERHRVPIVVTGFEPLDILEGIRRTVRQLEAGEHRVENAYPRAVQSDGSPAARAMLADVFEVTDRSWRGIGMIPASGWRLSPKYRDYDAEYRFSVRDIDTVESTVCRSGEVLQGLIKPHECAAFGTTCTPRNPLGATMVSSEGACAAYYLYRRLDAPRTAPAAAAQPPRAANGSGGGSSGGGAGGSGTGHRNGARRAGTTAPARNTREVNSVD